MLTYHEVGWLRRVILDRAAAGAAAAWDEEALKLLQDAWVAGPRVTEEQMLEAWCESSTPSRGVLEALADEVPWLRDDWGLRGLLARDVRVQRICFELYRLLAALDAVVDLTSGAIFFDVSSNAKHLQDLAATEEAYVLIQGLLELADGGDW